MPKKLYQVKRMLVAKGPGGGFYRAGIEKILCGDGTKKSKAKPSAK